MTMSEPAGALLARGGLLALLPLFFISSILLYLVLERCGSLGIEVLDLLPRLRKKKKEARGRLRESLAAYLGGPTQERREALRLACADLRIPLARFADRLARKGVDHDQSLGDLEVREAALLTEIEIERGLPVLASLSRAALLLGLLATFQGLSPLFHSMGFGPARDPGAVTSGLYPSLTLALTALTVSLVGTACASILTRRASVEGDDVRLVCERVRGLPGEVGW
jgi:biopolymer transport protein ExbB/TolQ